MATLDYWRDDPDAPFAELLAVLETFYHPELNEANGPEALSRLVHRVESEGFTSAHHDVPRFLAELRTALSDPGRLPDGQLCKATYYDEEPDDAAFLERVWRDIYPGRPLPSDG
ncbi:hypothetical protein [Allonocardiopsis opalescens]|uniref:CdiI immunity protein domain-containing protein n=1 Tax=Allonocardiopsis opalescens TaxID=1144618 RepID=A0A2T0Q0E5_9ACTN|nr:hypothetical protein [Allonocardiopsis opalescens]PRX97272.1 hypothetical protein CLV72_106309 [Allonocardiopsis opalescens]